MKTLIVFLALCGTVAAQSSLQENKNKQSSHPKVVTREVTGTKYAWVERAGVTVSTIYKGKDAEKQAKAFAETLK